MVALNRTLWYSSGLINRNEVTGGRQKYEQMQQIFFTQMQQNISLIIEQKIRSSGDLSPAQQEAQIAKFEATNNEFLGQLSEAVQAIMTYDEVLEHVYYPVYDQYFTEEDLRGLIAFYQTPVGEKLITVSPQILQTSIRLTSEIFMPRMIEVMNQLIEKQIEQQI